MTAHGPLAHWLDTRAPVPPPELVARLRDMAAPFGGREPTAEALLDAAEAAMATLLHDGCLTRASALDLLAVDALVTYAFEAAADDPERIEARTQQALARIAALAKPYPA
ncbi:MAG TPA: hypothetical protein VM076_12560 [Gemmatimonadaceae bacterium]|nr:hypothetical protein [Gemmatimonadaceae bacterium]